MAVVLTESAVKEVKKIMTEQSLEVEKHFLRVGVKGGGCSGFKFSLDITEDKNEEDEIWDYEGVRVVCDPRSLLYLNETTVDFKDGFIIADLVKNRLEYSYKNLKRSFKYTVERDDIYKAEIGYFLKNIGKKFIMNGVDEAGRLLGKILEMKDA